MASEPVTRLPVILLGCGGVGLQLLRHVASTRELHLSQGVRIQIVAVSDSSGTIVGPAGAGDDGARRPELGDESLDAIWRHKSQGNPLQALAAAQLSAPREVRGALRGGGDLAAIVPPGGAVVADCTAAATEDLLGEAAGRGCCIVLANKKPITAAMEKYDKIVATARRRFRCESTVGAGLPIMAALERLKASGDAIDRISGAFSGTLGFVMSGLQQGQLFSDVVLEAKRRGYTEPDPRDDLSGADVARKALIMARSLGWRLDMADVQVESLFPAAMAAERMAREEFLGAGLRALDADISARVAAAAAGGCVLRYTATLEGQKVGPQFVKEDSPLGRLEGSDNLVEIHTRCYSPTPLVIQGAGAGNDTTAAGVLADILDLQDLFCQVR